MKQIFRCEQCGKISETQEECCNHKMADLSSASCMSCQGCGHH